MTPDAPSVRLAGSPPGAPPRPVSVHRLPSAFRPAHALLVPSAVYLLWQGLAGNALIVVAWRDLGEAIAVWAVVGAGMGIPFGLLLAALGPRVERAMLGSTRRARGPWLGTGLGLSIAAHWLSIALWPLALFGAAVLGARAPGALGDIVIWGLGIWVAVGVGLVVGLRSVRRLADRPLVSDTPRRRVELPTSLLIGATYAVACATAAVLGTAWLSRHGWPAGAGAAAVLGWAFAGGAASVGAAGLAALWVRATERARSGGRRGAAPVASQLEMGGVVLAGHWGPIFAVSLTPVVQPEDLRWTLIAASFVAIVVGTWLWSIGRVR